MDINTPAKRVRRVDDGDVMERLRASRIRPTELFNRPNDVHEQKRKRFESILRGLGLTDDDFKPFTQKPISSTHDIRRVFYPELRHGIESLHNYALDHTLRMGRLGRWDMIWIIMRIASSSVADRYPQFAKYVE